jgi:ketosteroid isomerase-like protein
MSQENVEIVRQAVDAFNRRDLDAFRALLAPDTEIVPLRAEMEDTVFRGPNAAEEFFTAADQTWEMMRVEVEEIRDCGDRLLALGSFQARGRASGAEVTMKPGWVVRFREGTITSFHSFVHREEALVAAGLHE